MKITKSGSNNINNANNFTTITDMLIIEQKVWVTIHELLQFCRDKSWDPNGAHENNEDDFIDITDITDILSKI